MRGCSDSSRCWRSISQLHRHSGGRRRTLGRDAVGIRALDFACCAWNSKRRERPVSHDHGMRVSLLLKSRGCFGVDLNAPRPMLIFAAIDWTTEDRTPDDPDANYTLWVFADQTLSPGREEANRIPTAFLSSIERWTAQPAAGFEALTEDHHRRAGRSGRHAA